MSRHFLYYILHLSLIHIFVISKAMRAGYTVDQIQELTKIDKWFLQKLQHLSLIHI